MAREWAARTSRQSVAAIPYDAGPDPARQIVDELGHAKVPTTQDMHVPSRRTTDALEMIRGPSQKMC